jgi:uncharacterized protein YecE (DUF72 family)
MSAAIYIGTSGFSYDHWKGVFYPDKLPANRRLSFYCSRFDSVELNVTFYRLPREETFRRWFDETPDDFRFVLKGSRLITHLKKLASCEQPLAELAARSAELKHKLLGFLWQLPVSFHDDGGRLRSFLELLGSVLPHVLHCFEFRHASWFAPEILDLLRRRSACLCVADSPSYPGEKVLTSRACYLRFHGGKQLYSSGYTAEELAAWARTAKDWLPELDILLAFFNNDAQGFAVRDAEAFRGMLHKTEV